MIELKSIPRNADSYCERKLGEETIFLSPQGDEIHSLDEVGTYIWQQLDGQTELDAVLNNLCEEYDVAQDQARGDLLEFVAELVARKLLTVE